MTDRTQFENHLSDYIRDELSPDERREIDAYLDAHPEGLESLQELQEILGLTEQIHADTPPANLLREARSELLDQLAEPAPARSRILSLIPRLRLPRLPQTAYISGLAASIAIVAVTLLWPGSSSEVLADMIQKWREVTSLRVEGWIIDEEGKRTPYRQWLQAPHTFRAEVGAGDQQRTIIAGPDQRQIRDRDGTLYRETLPEDHLLNLQQAFSFLSAYYESERSQEHAYEFTEEDLDDSDRYTLWRTRGLGHGPSDFKHQIDIDRRTQLPLATRVFQQVDDQWLQMSELRYSDYDRPFPPKIFQIDPTEEARSIDDAAELTFWFERAISPQSAHVPAVHVPGTEVDLEWLDPLTVESRGVRAGHHRGATAGIVRQEFIDYSLHKILRHMTGHTIEDSPLAEQKLSLIATFKYALPWQRRIQPLLDHLGLQCELGERDTTRTRFIVTQDGRDLPPSRHRFSYSRVKGSMGMSYEFNFERTPLRSVVANVFNNCTAIDFDAELDTLECAWDGPPERSPFRREVDLEFSADSGDWEESYQTLRKNFGIQLSRTTETITLPILKLRPAQQ
jgi:hypothetical protein